jgi:hypothetical protein
MLMKNGTPLKTTKLSLPANLYARAGLIKLKKVYTVKTISPDG